MDYSCKQSRLRLVETRYWPGFCKFYPCKSEKVALVPAVIKNCRIAETIWVSSSVKCVCSGREGLTAQFTAGCRSVLGVSVFICVLAGDRHYELERRWKLPLFIHFS